MPDTNNRISLKRLQEYIKQSQAKFEMEVEAASLEVTAIAKDISGAIGTDISLVEAKDAIVREFRKRLG